MVLGPYVLGSLVAFHVEGCPSVDRAAMVVLVALDMSQLHWVGDSFILALIDNIMSKWLDLLKKAVSFSIAVLVVSIMLQDGVIFPSEMFWFLHICLIIMTPYIMPYISLL